MRLVKVGGVFMIVVAVAIHDEKHIHVESYHGAPQAMQPMNTYTATATAIPVFSWDLMDFR